MRIRVLCATALLTLPCVLPAQVLRIPRRGSTPEPAPLPPTAEPVGRALSIQRSKWSAEGYSLFSVVQTSDASGVVSRYSTFGTGTHADYRYADHFTATVDVTASFLGAQSQTAELGTRYSPLTWEHQVRPFFDIRGGYMNLLDQYAGSLNAGGVGAAQNVAEGRRYSRGFGGIAGAGAEFTVASNFAVTTELMAMRNNMTTYRLTSTSSLPVGNDYRLTSYRLVFGIRYNPLNLHAAQPTR